MVRHKVRWLLVSLDSEKNAGNNNNEGGPPSQRSSPTPERTVEEDTPQFPTRKELARNLRDWMVQCLGESASGTAMETQGRCGGVERKVGLGKTAFVLWAESASFRLVPIVELIVGCYHSSIL